MLSKNLIIIAVFTLCVAGVAHAQEAPEVGPLDDQVEPLQKKKYLIIPNLKGLTKAKAIAKLKALGHRGNVYIEDHMTCPRGSRFKVGQVCKQSLNVGKRTNMKVPIKLVIKERPRKKRKRR